MKDLRLESDDALSLLLLHNEHFYDLLKFMKDFSLDVLPMLVSEEVLCTTSQLEQTLIDWRNGEFEDC